MWHAVVVIETRCELVLDCMREPWGVRAPGRRLPANRQAWQAIASEPTSQHLDDVVQVAEVQGVGRRQVAVELKSASARESRRRKEHLFN